MPQRKSNMVCPDWAKRELYGEPYVTRQEVCEYLGISISTLMKLRRIRSEVKRDSVFRK